MKRTLLFAAAAWLLVHPLAATAQCPYLTGAFVDACNGNGSEGDNEFMMVRNGNTALSPNTLNLYYSSAIAGNGTVSGNVNSNTFHFGGSGFSNTYTAAELAFIDNLNTSNTCSPATTIFYRPATTSTPVSVPAGALMIVLQIGQTTPYDWTGLCGQAQSQQVYILFEHNNNGNGSGTTYGNGFNTGGSGRFKNNSGSNTTTPRYFSLTSSAYPGCTEASSVRTYTPSQLPSYMGSTDGGFVSWNAGGTTSYSNNGCAAPIVLPLKLISFRGTEQDGRLKLTWETACETSMAPHVLEKSVDGHFSLLATIPAQNGGCSSTGMYTYTDDAFSNGPQLYRLRMTDQNGDIAYSPTLSFNNGKQAAGKLALQQNPVTTELTVTGMETGIPYRITDAAGQPLITGTANGGRDLIPVAALTPGFYVLQAGGTALRFIKQ